jgi:hypothetical protein
VELFELFEIFPRMHEDLYLAKSMALKILQSIFVLFSGRRSDYSTPADDPKNTAATQAARERNRLANERSLKKQAEETKKKVESLPPSAS